MKYPIYYLAQANGYSCGAYGSGTYNSSCDATNTSTGANASGGLLADTGYNVIIPVALATAIIVATIIYLVRRARRNRKG